MNKDITYARQIVSNFNAHHGTALSLRKNAYSGGYDIINRDMEIVQTAQIPESLSEFINGRTDPNYFMTQKEYDRLLKDLQNILNDAKKHKIPDEDVGWCLHDNFNKKPRQMAGFFVSYSMDAKAHALVPDHDQWYYW